MPFFSSSGVNISSHNPEETFEEIKAIVKEVLKDRALVSKNKANIGGINLDPAMLDLQIKRNGNGVPLPIGEQDFSMMHIQGFLPIIINVAPVSLPALLGFVDTLPAAGPGEPSDDVSLWFEDRDKFLLRQNEDIFGLG